MTLVRAVDPPAHSVAQVRGWIDLMMPAAELARTVAPTDFVPKAFRNNPPAITAAILYGDEIGIGPMQSLKHIRIIEGNPWIAAEAQRALILAAGHQIWPEELSTTRATWCGRRAGSEQVTRITWTIDDARRARIDGKPNWRAWPRQMLSARASAELARAVFADVIGGLGAIEEADEIAADASAPTAVDAQPSAVGTKRRRRAVAAAPTDTEATRPPVADVTPMPPLPGEEASQPTAEPVESDEPLSQRQLNRLQSLCRSRGIGDRSDRITLASEVIGRTITSSKDLTSAEADRFIGYLEELPAVDRDEQDQQGLDI